MAIEIPKDRSITGDEARQAFIYGLEKVLKQKVDPDSVVVKSDDMGSICITETKQDKEGKPVVKVTNISKLDLSLSADTLAERQTRLAALIAESKKAMFKFDKKAAVGAPAGGAPATHAQPVLVEDVPFADF